MVFSPAPHPEVSQAPSPAFNAALSLRGGPRVHHDFVGDCPDPTRAMLTCKGEEGGRGPKRWACRKCLASVTLYRCPVCLFTAGNQHGELRGRGGRIKPAWGFILRVRGSGAGVPTPGPSRVVQTCPKCGVVRLARVATTDEQGTKLVGVTVCELCGDSFADHGEGGCKGAECSKRPDRCSFREDA